MAKFKEDTKTKGIKAPAAQRCNRQDPRSPHQRKLRRRAEAHERATHPDLQAQAALKKLHPKRKLPKNTHAKSEIAREVIDD